MSIRYQKAVLDSIIAGQITHQEASGLMSCSIRTVQRKLARYKLLGADGLMHRLTGRRSNRAKPENLKEQVVLIFQEQAEVKSLSDFIRQVERKGIDLSRETIRKWLIEAGLWEAGCRGRPCQSSVPTAIEGTPQGEPVVAPCACAEAHDCRECLNKVS